MGPPGVGTWRDEAGCGDLEGWCQVWGPGRVKLGVGTWRDGAGCGDPEAALSRYYLSLLLQKVVGTVVKVEEL